MDLEIIRTWPHGRTAEYRATVITSCPEVLLQLLEDLVIGAVPTNLDRVFL